LNGGERLLGIELRRSSASVDVDLLATEVCDQVLPGVGAIGAAANDCDHVIEVIQSREVALENVLAVLGFLQKIRGAPADHIYPVIYKDLNGLNQAHFFRLTMNHREQDHAEVFLHLRVLEELIQDDLRFSAAL